MSPVNRQEYEEQLGLVTGARHPAMQGNGDGVGVKLTLGLVLGKMSDTLDGLNQATQRVHRFLTANERTSPIARPLRGVVTSDGSTYVYADLGTVTAGRVWDVRRLAIYPGGGTDVVTPLSAVSAFVVTMANVPVAGTTTCSPFDDLLLAPGAVPNDAEFSAHQATVPNGMHVVLVVKSLTNATQVAATGQAEEYIVSAREEVVA